jgi:hypothetical protein
MLALAPRFECRHGSAMPSEGPARSPARPEAGRVALLSGCAQPVLDPGHQRGDDPPAERVMASRS